MKNKNGNLMFGRNMRCVRKVFIMFKCLEINIMCVMEQKQFIFDLINIEHLFFVSKSFNQFNRMNSMNYMWFLKPQHED